MQAFSEGITIVTDVEDQIGVETLVGRIGFLLAGEKSQCNYLEIKPGMYCEEHPHDFERLIFTVKGQWVLSSRGKRFHMKAGSLFWCGANVPTGYGAPFEENAFLMIFRGAQTPESQASMLDHLRGLKERLEQRNQEGEPFTFAELPKDHPAVLFAAECISEKRQGGDA